MNTAQLNKLCNVEIPKMDNYSLLRIISIATLTMSERLIGDKDKVNALFSRCLEQCDGSVDDLMPELLVDISAGAWSFANKF